MDEDLSSSFAFIIALTPRALPPPPPAATSNRAPPRGHGHVPGERAAHLEHQRVHGGRGLHPHDAGASTPAPPLCEIARHLKCLPPSAAIVPLTSLSRDPQGPRGLDKLVHDDKGVTTISNDGATIMKVRREAPISRATRQQTFFVFPTLRCRRRPRRASPRALFPPIDRRYRPHPPPPPTPQLLDIVHPAAKSLVDIAKSQDSEVRASPPAIDRSIPRDRARSIVVRSAPPVLQKKNRASE